jgi:glucose-6-phosphate dehydrogenase assembly protein OpcA
MDIEWTRSSQVRMAIAGLFDDPMAVNALEHVSELNIVVHPEHRMAGLQLLAWVIQRTGWKRCCELSLDSDHGDVYYYETSEGSALVAKIVADPLSAPVGAMEFIAPGLELRVTRDAGSAYICQELHAGAHHIERRTPSNSDDSAELVMNQLSRGGNNSLYCAVMPEFLALLGGE